MTRRSPRVLALLSSIAACLLVPVGCGDRKPVDPGEQARTGKTDVPTRVAAVDELWAREKDGDRAAARESLKRIAWQASIPGAVRIRAIELLAADTSDTDQADTRNMLRLMLSTEPNMDVIACISGLAGRGGARWADLTPALVRSYSRKTDPPPDAERPERAALLAIHPGKPIERIAFDVFLQPLPVSASPAELERAKKAKAAGWELLSRLDVDGRVRTAFLQAESSAGDPVVDDLRACAADLKCIPLTASQLEWLQAMRSTPSAGSSPDPQSWWAQSRAAIAALPPDRLAGWALRHIEPLRWAAGNRPELLAKDRASLESDLRARFRGRAVAIRGDADRGGGELFADRAASFSWGDLLTIAVADEAVRDPAVLAALPALIARDRKDTSTEYGGLVEWSESKRGWNASLFQPRPGQRRGDNEFVAPAEMLTGGARAAFHYHFHVQREENREYAGPGPGDLEFADNQGRACIVFTTLRAGVVNADYYQVGRAIVDLGELKIAAEK